MVVRLEDFAGATAEAAMLKGLQNLVQDQLRVIFQDAAKEVIDHAVADAMKAFEARITAYVTRDSYSMDRMLKVVVEYKKVEST